MNRSWAILYLGAALAAAQTISIEQSISLSTVQSAQISPDGQFVVYTVQETDWEQNAFTTQLWICPSAGCSNGTPRRLTYGKGSSSQPRWSPDSQRIAFRSSRDAGRQIYVIPATGGEAFALTHEEREIGFFDWSPDGKSIAYASPGPEPKESKSRRARFSDYEVINEDIVRSGIWLIPVPENQPSNPSLQPKPELVMTDASLDVQTFSWSPDGKRIAFEAQQEPGYTSDETARIYLLDLASKHTAKIIDSGVPNHKPVWSPDGKQIAFMTIAKGKPSFPANLEIAITNPAQDNATAASLTATFDESARLIDWGPDGIYFGVFQLESALYRLDPATRKMTRLTPQGAGGVGGASLSRDHRKLAGIAVRPNLLAEVFVSPVEPFAPQYLTNMNAQRTGYRFATREAIRWKSVDGTEVEGILIKPPGYDPARKYPLLVVIHGGPATLDNLSYTPDRDYPIELFAAKGALLLKPNYRGSTGYGEKFRTLIIGQLGIGPYEDVISGVDSLIAKGMVDDDRLGVMGWSQGGHNTAFAATYSNRFKAASVGAGITNWTTYYVNTDLQWFTRQMLQSTPWENPAAYAKQSPITYAGRSTTPTLLQHGARDPRVPVPNAFELYRALKDRGIPTKLILYSGYGHMIDKPKGQLAVMQHNYEWFLKYIWGEVP